MRADGTKEVLGLWIEQNERAKFWLRVLNELKNRGVEDILLAVVDGQKGFPEAITAAFPETAVQTCIVHLLRHSMEFASWKDRKPVAAALKQVYDALDDTEAERALTAFEQGPWGQKYEAIGKAWRRAWQEVIPFFAFPRDVRRILYTTNAIEALNSKLRRAVRARGHFPNDEAALKLLLLVLNRAEKEWKMPAHEWTAAKAQMAAPSNPDEALIRLLETDGRMPTSSLARSLSPSETATRARLERLLNEGKFDITLVLDASAMGYTIWADIRLSVKPVHLQSALSNLVKHRDVILVGHICGGNDILIFVVVRTVNDLDEFVREEIRNLEGMIDYSIMRVPAVIKYDFNVTLF